VCYGVVVEGRGKGASVGVVVDNISNIRLKLSDQRMWLQLKHACGPDWFDNTNGDIRAGCAAVWLAARTNAGLQGVYAVNFRQQNPHPHHHDVVTGTALDQGGMFVFISN
jgi:hypothetical protein